MTPDEQITYNLTQWAARKGGYDLYRRYADGHHMLRFATQDFEEKYGQQVKSLRENLCEAAYTTFTDRLAVESWGDKASVDTVAEEGLSRVLGLPPRSRPPVGRCTGPATRQASPGPSITTKAAALHCP